METNVVKVKLWGMDVGYLSFIGSRAIGALEYASKAF